MKIVIFGLTITSSWGNGHATTYRSLCKALALRGHTITFVEKDVEWYRSNRDLPAPQYCNVWLYDDWSSVEASALQLTKDADVVVVGSYFADAIACTTAIANKGCGLLLFYDIDTPITITALRAHGECNYLNTTLMPRYTAYLSFTGGPVLNELQTEYGAQQVFPFYCSVDADAYYPTDVCETFQCDLSYLGTYAADRQPKLMDLLNGSAELLHNARFIVAGAMYPESTILAPNVDRITHLPPRDHPAFYSSSRFTLNLTRDDMVAAGYSPSVRLFEASACGVAILSDAWPGLEQFLTPGEEILLPRDAVEVTHILNELSDEDRLRMGRRARDRILSEHSSLHRAMQFEQIVSSLG